MKKQIERTQEVESTQDFIKRIKRRKRYYLNKIAKDNNYINYKQMLED